MHRAQDQVREFYLKLGAPTCPAPPAFRDAMLRARLILEEAMETAVGLVGTTAAISVAQDFMKKEYTRGDRRPDLVEAVDGLCDLTYVTYGTAEALGVDLEPHFDVVHEANMQKENRPIDGHGKRGHKPEGWVDPKVKIAHMLEADVNRWAEAWERRYRR